jgi:cytochrome c-type biogenesis protein CcmH/NrfG
VKRSIAVLALLLAAAGPALIDAGTPVHAADAKAKPAAAPVDSLVLLERQVAKDSTKFDRLYQVGVMYLDRDRVAEAIRAFGKAHQLKPKDVKTLVNLGAAYDASGIPASAQKYYREALALAPSDSIASCRLASSLYSQGKHQESVDQLRDILRVQPTSYCAYFTMGVAFADAGIYRDAVRMWRKVIELAPASAEAVSAKESIEVLEKYIP